MKKNTSNKTDLQLSKEKLDKNFQKKYVSKNLVCIYIWVYLELCSNTNSHV